MKQSMRVLLAFVAPPLAVLSCGRPFAALLNVFLTLCFWVPGMVHALVAVWAYNDSRRVDATVARMEEGIAEAHGLEPGSVRVRRPRGGIVTTLVRIVALVVFYVLSTGPVYLLFELTQPPPWARQAKQTAYAPLEIAWRHSPLFRRIYVPYAQWWIALGDHLKSR